MVFKERTSALLLCFSVRGCYLSSVLGFCQPSELIVNSNLKINFGADVAVYSVVPVTVAAVWQKDRADV